MRTFLRDTYTVFARELGPELRSVIGILFAMGQPLLFLVVFGSLLAGSGADLGGRQAGDAGTWQWFVPGILLMMCLLGPFSAGHQLLLERNSGVLERFFVTPLSRAALILGRTAKDVATLVAQAVLIVAVAVPLGMRLNPVGVLASLVLLMVLAVGLSGFSYLLATLAGANGSLYWIVTQVLVFPLLLLSGTLLPIESGPDWLRVAAAVNPVHYVLDATRALFAGDYLSVELLYGGLAAAGLAALGLWLAARAMRRSG